MGTFGSTVDPTEYAKYLDSNVHPEFGIEYLNDRRAQAQGSGEQFVNMLNQAIVGEIIGGTVEGVGYLLDLKQYGDLLRGTEQDFGNWFSDIGKDIKAWTQEVSPVYTDYKPGAFRPAILVGGCPMLHL